MVSLSTTICCVISLLVCLVLPVIIAPVFALKYKKEGIISAWLLGAAGFFVTQILIRVPILTALQSQPWFLRAICSPTPLAWPLPQDCSNWQAGSLWQS